MNASLRASVSRPFTSARRCPPLSEWLEPRRLLNAIAPVAVDDAYATLEDQVLAIPGPGVRANDTDAPGANTIASIFSGGTTNASTMFYGRAGITFPWNSAGSTFTPASDILLTEVRVACHADGGAPGTPRMTLFRFDVAAPGHYDSIGAELGYTEAVTGYGELTGFDFTGQGIILSAGQRYAYILSNDQTSIPGPVHYLSRYAESPEWSMSYSQGGWDVSSAFRGSRQEIYGMAPPYSPATVVEYVAHGELALAADGSFTYTPAPGYSGPDSFTYVLNGPPASAPATVSLTVEAVNDAPVAADDAATVDEDTTLDVAVPGVLANDTDVDSPTLTAALVDGPAHGTLTLNPDGSYSYTPSPNYNGPDSFTYRASDGDANSATATVSLAIAAVNDAPVASPFAVSRNPGSAVNVDVLANAQDAEGGPLTLAIAVAPARGTAVIRDNGTPADLSDDYVLYTPQAGYYGPDAFTFSVTDSGGLSGEAAVTVNALPVGLSPNPTNRRKTDLIIVGTSGNDQIRLTRTSKGVKVVYNGVVKGVFNPTARIIVQGLAGNDLITATALRRPVIFSGGAGNDTLIGSHADDQLDGGPGRDVIR